MAKKQGNKRDDPSKRTVDKKPQKSTSFSFKKVFMFLFSILIGVSSFFLYNIITKTPETPQVDLEYWWGPYPIDSSPDLSLRPFRIEFSDVKINDLKERLLHRHDFAPPLENSGFTYGFNSAFITKVLDYWQNKYNFKEREQFFNRYNHFVTKIQGLDIHYIHVKPKVSSDISIVPILLLHGWPGSVREFYEIIPKLTTPREGQKFVFEVIAPSLPGFGFSQGAVRSGLGATEISVIMYNLMKRIGHTHYYVHGGDAGHTIGAGMATLFPDNILGFHTNFPVLLFHPLANLYSLVGSLWPSLVVEPELQDRMYPWSERAAFTIEESGYMHLQATKPDTIGIALSDSPAGLAAYILEKFSTWTNPKNKLAVDGNLLSKFTLTALLDNVMVYWATNSITSSMRLYAETMSSRHLALKMDEIPTKVPTWGIKFKYELLFQPDAVLKLKFKNYLHSTVVDDGGHFAALENPDILAHDIFEAVETFREFHAGEKNPAVKQPVPEHEYAKSIYDFTVKDINGKEVKLDKYKGHVSIIVNVASECGLTDRNYNELNELYEKYSETKGLRILAFPCNQFNSQEPGAERDILNFTKKRGVKFDLYQKVEVNGENAHPLWKFLKTTQKGTLGDFIKWNFSKFIVDKNGVPVERLGPHVNPLDLEPYLAKYW